MTDWPIPFSEPMVRALLEGSKTQTRRALYVRRKVSPIVGSKVLRYVLCPLPADVTFDAAGKMVSASIGVDEAWTLARWNLCKPDDRLWVREAWRTSADWDAKKPRDIEPDDLLRYEASGARWLATGKYRHARFMPRRLSRLTLMVKAVKIERLQDIGESDARAEGIGQRAWPDRDGRRHFGVDDIDEPTAARGYSRLWDTINGEGSWALNPWVVAIEFDVHNLNIDAMPAPTTRGDEK